MSTKSAARKKRFAKEFPHLAVKRSSAGMGLYATIDMEKGDFIADYEGRKITHAQSDRQGGKYLFTLNDQWVIDGSTYDNIARYFNHSCRPNIEAVIEDDENIAFYAIQDIAVGDELCFDYGKEYFDDIIMAEGGCRCAYCATKNKKR